MSYAVWNRTGQVGVVEIKRAGTEKGEELKGGGKGWRC